MSIANRDFNFYNELVIVTVISLVAANVWIRLLTQSLDRFFPNSLVVDFIVAVVITFLAIWGLYTLFSEGKKQREREEASSSSKKESSEKSKKSFEDYPTLPGSSL